VFVRVGVQVAVGKEHGGVFVLAMLLAADSLPALSIAETV
jgi:hypothetical protein